MTSSFPSIFAECQRSIATHKKCIAAATKLLLTNQKAIKEFISCVDRVLVVDKRHPAVERCVSFIGNLVASYSSDCSDDRKPIWSPLLAHLLERANVKDASVRFRVCQIIAETMSLLPEDVEISDELWDDLCEKMVLRTKDKAAITRSYAVRALARLQDPSESEDPVITEYIRLLSTDPTKEVRKAVLSNMGISKKTLPHILQRSRDLSDDIRKETYQLIGRKVDVRALTIVQRQQLLEGGLQDRSDEVRKAVVAMTAGWLNMDMKDTEETSQVGIEWLLRCLDVENDGESAARMVIQELYKAQLLQLPKLDLCELSSETALMWRVMCELWKEHKDSQLECLPELSHLCRVIAQHQTSSNRFVVRQLIQLTKFVDLADEVGRRNLNALVCQMLCNLQTPLEYIPPLLESLCSFHSSKDFTSLVLEIISEVRYPLYGEGGASGGKSQDKSHDRSAEGGGEAESDGTSSGEEEDTHHHHYSPRQASEEEELRSATQARLLELNKQLATLDSKHSKKRSLEAKRTDEELRTSLETDRIRLEEIMANLTQQISQKEDAESKIWCQSLDMALFLLQHTNKMKEHTGVMEIHSVMLSKALSHPLPVVRVRGVCCTVLYCLLDYTTARDHVSIFLELLLNDLPAIQLTVIKGLFDVIAYFGLLILQDSDEFKGEKLLSLLSTYMLHDDEDFRYAAVEGFAKLFMADITTSPQQLTHLVLLFFNPTTADDLELRQCLSLFFSVFACSNFAAHSAKIQLPHAAQFLLTLLDNSNNQTSDHSSLPLYNHAKVALELAHEILASPKDYKELCKVLNYCNVTEEDQDLLKAIEFLVGEILEHKAILQDKLILKGLAKFAATLKRADKTPNTSLTPSKVDKIRDKIRLISDNIDKADSNKDEEPKMKGKAQRRPAQRKPAQTKSVQKSNPKRRTYISGSESSGESEPSDSDSTDSGSSEEEERLTRAPVRAPSTRRANLAAKSKMKDISSDESDAEESCESDAQSTDEGFEESQKEIGTLAERLTPSKTNPTDASDSDPTDTESEGDTASEPELTHLPTVSKPAATKSANQITKTSKITKRSESDDDDDSDGDGDSNSDSDSHQLGDEPKQDNSAAFAIAARVRQVSLYDSSDEGSGSDHNTEVSIPSMQANKENQPENIPAPTKHTKTSPLHPKLHVVLQQAQPSMNTSKKQRYLKLDQEIGDLLDGDDPKQSLMQQTDLQVQRLLLEEIPSPLQHPLPVLLKSAVNSSRTTLHAMPVRVSPKGATTKVQTTRPTKNTTAASTTSNTKQVPLQRPVQPSGSRASIGSTKAPTSVIGKAATSKIVIPPSTTIHMKSPPLSSSSQLSTQPTPKPRTSLLSASNKPFAPSLPLTSSKPTLLPPRVPLVPRKPSTTHQ